MRALTFWACSVAAAAWIVLALPSPLHADTLDKAMDQIEKALETNPAGVPAENITSCRAMLKTARLLHKMGRNTRALRRINACRELLRLDGSVGGRVETRTRWG